jgi:hypothetical protein
VGVVKSIRSALVQMGLASPPFEPHEFERSMQMLSHPPSAGPSVATVPIPVTTMSSSARCAREHCGRPMSDLIHQVGGE